jgi:hypothetical protein
MSMKLALGFALLLTACSGPATDGAPTPSVSSTQQELPSSPQAIPLVRGVGAPAAPLRGDVARKPAQRSAADVLASDDLEAFNAMATTVAAQKQALGNKKMDCISKGLALDSSMHGHVELSVRLDADGAVRSTEVVSNRNLPPAVVACIRHAVGETHFLPPATPRDFTRTESAGIP